MGKFEKALPVLRSRRQKILEEIETRKAENKARLAKTSAESSSAKIKYVWKPHL